ncbi:hypothetical protein D3C86_1566680 [compost metagenome]
MRPHAVLQMLSEKLLANAVNITVLPTVFCVPIGSLLINFIVPVLRSTPVLDAMAAKTTVVATFVINSFCC